MGKNADMFWKLMRESVIIQGLVTLALLGCTCYLWVTGTPVPQELLGFDGLVLGFFFGAKVQQATANRRTPK